MTNNRPLFISLYLPHTSSHLSLFPILTPCFLLLLLLTFPPINHDTGFPGPLLTSLPSITPILPVISDSSPSVPQSWAGGAPAWSQSSASRLHHSGELPDCTGGGMVLTGTNTFKKPFASVHHSSFCILSV